MVANKELEAGEEIITEMPFIVGPKAATYPLCLSCYVSWPPSLNEKPLCSKCGWPVCSTECENQPQHKDYECQVAIMRIKKQLASLETTFLHLTLAFIFLHFNEN